MISTDGTRIWTHRGWLFSEDLQIGDRVMSFSEVRGVCEDDEVQSIQLERRQCMGLGVWSKSMKQLLTPDHPLLLWDSGKKTMRRTPIQDKFMYCMRLDSGELILLAALYEPYLRTQDELEIKLSARYAATNAKHRFAPAHIDVNMGGYESQLWLDTFVHWNKLIPARNWQATVEVNNRTIRDAVYNIASRAGVGMLWYPRNTKWVASITTNGYIATLKNAWFRRPIDGLMFNITTKNGSALAKSNSGTFLVACNKGE